MGPPVASSARTASTGEEAPSGLEGSELGSEEAAGVGAGVVLTAGPPPQAPSTAAAAAATSILTTEP